MQLHLNNLIFLFLCVKTFLLKLSYILIQKTIIQTKDYFSIKKTRKLERLEFKNKS